MNPMSGSERRCLCPGSYDPVTNGHLDIIRRAATIFDEVVVAILHNPGKQGTFTVEERIDLLELALADIPNARVEAFAGQLVVDVCARVGAATMVKGLRGGTDFSYERPMANMNRTLTGVETLFLAAEPTLQHVSSSLIKEVVRYGGDVTGMVPEHVRRELEARLR